MPSFANRNSLSQRLRSLSQPSFRHSGIPISTDDDDAELPIKVENLYAVKGVRKCLQYLL